MTCAPGGSPLTERPRLVVVCGPEGSGTNMLTDLLVAAGIPAVQRSLPRAEVWWVGEDGATWDPMTGEPWPAGTVFVTIYRDPHCTVQSVMRRHLSWSAAAAEAARAAAVDRLAVLPALVVQYERLVAGGRCALVALADALLFPDAAIPDDPGMRDENAKWSGSPTN